jgi:aspartyl-tRNA(Asn)/glutamyl-tRNA(Gln) amidotransferase subunit B
VTADQARLLAYRSELGDFFEHVVQSGDGGGDGRAIANWVTNELVATLGDAELEESALDPAAFARLVSMVGAGEVSGSAAKEVLAVLIEEGGDPASIVAERGLAKAGGDELQQIVETALAANADAVEKIRSGNDKAIGAIVGAVMRETKGRADGGEVQRLIREKLGA